MTSHFAPWERAALSGLYNQGTFRTGSTESTPRIISYIENICLSWRSTLSLNLKFSVTIYLFFSFIIKFILIIFFQKVTLLPKLHWRPVLPRCNSHPSGEGGPESLRIVCKFGASLDAHIWRGADLCFISPGTRCQSHVERGDCGGPSVFV